MSTPSPDSATPGVVTSLYLSTKTLHAEAERTGIIRDMLRGDVSRTGYVTLMRNLWPAYAALEQGLDRHRTTPALQPLAAYRLDRAPAIAADLDALAGSDWPDRWPLLPEGAAYADRIATAAEGDGARLIAHAYTRYLGDLSGGQILRRLLARSLALRDDELSFYDFKSFADPAALKTDYRNALEAAGRLAADPAAIVAEGATAFSLNIALSCAVRDRVARTDAAE